MQHMMARHGRHGGGGKGRFFEQGDLRYVVLKLISEKPSYGYEIIKAIEDRLAGAYAPSPGIVYPTLTLLEELGYIKVQETDGPRKLFAITPEGEVALEQNKAVVDAIFARMAEVHVRHGGHQAPQLVRAWENLKMAMNLRVAQGPLTAQQIEEIAAILDGAAKSIESSK
jgi:DNA-binding PadR family transcriptional regulator